MPYSGSSKEEMTRRSAAITAAHASGDTVGAGRSRELLEKHLRQKGIINF
jgi:hypothetical protein